MIIYGLKTCDTCRKARKWLEAKGIECTFRDVREDGLDAGDVAKWLNAVGEDTLINRRGTTWRQLSDDRKAATGIDALTALIVDHPAIMKRPVFVRNSHVIVGFRDEQMAILKKYS